MADVRLPTAHWAARLTILFVLAAILFTAAFTGVIGGAARWATDCGSRIATHLWAPLLDTDDPNDPYVPRPLSGCLRDGTGPSA